MVQNVIDKPLRFEWVLDTTPTEVAKVLTSVKDISTVSIKKQGRQKMKQEQKTTSTYCSTMHPKVKTTAHNWAAERTDKFKVKKKTAGIGELV